MQVEVIAFGKSASQRLKDSADDFIDMSAEPRKFLMGQTKNILSMAAGAMGAAPEPEMPVDTEEVGEPKVVGAD